MSDFLGFTVIPGTGDSDEGNLLYVAVTRAKNALQITNTIRNVLKQAGVSCLSDDWHFLESEDVIFTAAAFIFEWQLSPCTSLYSC